MSEELTSEEVKKLIDARIDEYWRIAKLVFWIVGAMVALFFSAISSLFLVNGVKDAVVASLVKVDKLFDEPGRTFLNGEIDKYFRSERPALVFDTGSTAPLKLKATEAFNERFSDNLKLTVSNIVAAYSFSTSFQLSDELRDHNLRFLKQEGSTAEIDCIAVYSQSDAKKNVNMTLNNFLDQGAVVPKPNSAQGRGHVKLAGDNAQYFPDKSKINITQSMIFVVDADSSFQGSIWVDCTVMVIGPARLARGF
jgi:hypothetical protein